MRILTVLGSPRKHGNTAEVLSCFEQITARQHEVRRINIIDQDVRGCTGCSHCQKVFDRPGCRQKDDMPALIHHMLAADVIVYASPLYAWDFTAQMKAFIDRHFCLIKWDANPVASLLQGKRAALLVTCGDAVEDNADLIQVVFERQMDCAQVQVIGKYVLPHCPSKRGGLGERAEQLAQVMAREIL